MLPQFYLDYLKTYLPDSELLTIKILVWLLQVHRQVRIERLASSFPYPIKCESRRKKIQRFLILPRLSLPLLWFPLIKKIISSQFKKGDRLILTIDRTQWKTNNISMVSVIWKKRTARAVLKDTASHKVPRLVRTEQAKSITNLLVTLI